MCQRLQHDAALKQDCLHHAFPPIPPSPCHNPPPPPSCPWSGIHVTQPVCCIGPTWLCTQVMTPQSLSEQPQFPPQGWTKSPQGRVSPTCPVRILKISAMQPSLLLKRLHAPRAPNPARLPPPPPPPKPPPLWLSPPCVLVLGCVGHTMLARFTSVSNTNLCFQ